MAEDLEKLILSEDGTSFKVPTWINEESAVVKMNMDNLDEEEKKRLYQAILEKSDVALHEGNVEHGYSLEKLGSVETCPRCSSPTERRCAYFVYATEAGARVMMTTAGFFCRQCPTAIIDESVIRAGITGNFQYRGIVGFHHDDRETNILSTWNGEKPVFILDESEDIIGVITQEMQDRLTRLPLPPSSQFQSSAKKDRKAARRRELAKASRKRNRQNH